MATILRSTWPVFRDIHKEVGQLFEPSIVSAGNARDERPFTPPVDIIEMADKFIIEAELPGIDPKEINIAVQNNLLTLKAQRENANSLSEQNYSKKERYYGLLCRKFTLPDGIDVQKIQAKGKHGVLEIILPKKEVQGMQKFNVVVEEG